MGSSNLIFNGFAFSENEKEKFKQNMRMCKELHGKYKIYRNDLRMEIDINMNDYDVVIGRKPGYNHAEYKVFKNTPNLSDDELMLLCDGGNLCFGGVSLGNGRYRISED